MGGSHMGKESKGWSLIEIYICGPDYFKISGPDRGPKCNIFQPSNICLGLTKS
jgi:hypothetical protein